MTKSPEQLPNITAKSRNKHCSGHFEGCLLSRPCLYCYSNLQDVYCHVHAYTVTVTYRMSTVTVTYRSLYIYHVSHSNYTQVKLMVLVWFIVFSATCTFNNISVISWWSVFLVKETRVPEKTTDLSQTLSHNVVS